jgi:hypothetical protein
MIELRFARVEYRDFGCISWFPDGAHVEAIPHTWNHHYSVISHRGYGDDLLAYCRDG